MSGNIGAEIEARAAPDGYALMLLTAAARRTVPPVVLWRPFETLASLAPQGEVI